MGIGIGDGGLCPRTSCQRAAESIDPSVRLFLKGLPWLATVAPYRADDSTENPHRGNLYM